MRLMPLLLIASLVSSTQTDKEEVAKMQGEWRVVGMENRGESAPKEMLQAATMVVRDNKMTLSVPAQGKGQDLKREFTVVLDATKDPKHIDGTALQDPYKGTVSQGIYRLTDDEMVICIQNLPDRARPTEFRTGPDMTQVLISLKREKK